MPRGRKNARGAGMNRAGNSPDDNWTTGHQRSNTAPHYGRRGNGSPTEGGMGKIIQAILLSLPAFLGSLLASEFLHRFLPTESAYRDRYQNNENKPSAVENEKAMDPYAALGLEKGALLDVAKKQYRKLALQYHPDRQVGKSLEECASAEIKMKEINMAYRRVQAEHGTLDESNNNDHNAPDEAQKGNSPSTDQRQAKYRKKTTAEKNEEARFNKEFEDRYRREMGLFKQTMERTRKHNDASDINYRQSSQNKQKTDPHVGANKKNSKDPADTDLIFEPPSDVNESTDMGDANGSHAAHGIGHEEDLAAMAFESSVHPLAVAIRSNLLYIFWSIISDPGQFNTGEMMSLYDLLDDEKNNVMHYCVFYGRDELGSSILSNAGSQWHKLVFGKNAVGKKPSDLLGVQAPFNGESGSSSNLPGQVRLVDELKRFEASGVVSSNRTFDWQFILITAADIFSGFLVLRSVNYISLGWYESLLVILLRIAPAVESLDASTMTVACFYIITGFRLFLYLSWSSLIFGGISAVIVVFSLYACFKQAFGLSLLLLMISFETTLLAAKIVSTPGSMLLPLIEQQTVYIIEIAVRKDIQKRVLFLTSKFLSLIKFVMNWCSISVFTFIGCNVYGIGYYIGEMLVLICVAVAALFSFSRAREKYGLGTTAGR